MKTLIVYAHPAQEGHCFSILQETKKLLKERKIDFETVDLYQIGFDPVLHDNELYSHGRREISPATKALQEKVSAAKRIIFIYPVWWNSMPAMMKGFVDKVLTSPFAYKYEGGIPRRHLVGKKSAIMMTTGSPHALASLFLGGRAAKIMTHDTLWFCGIKAKAFYLYSCKKFNDRRMEKVKRFVPTALKWLYKTKF